MQAGGISAYVVLAPGSNSLLKGLIRDSDRIRHEAMKKMRRPNDHSIIPNLSKYFIRKKTAFTLLIKSA